MIDVSIIVPIFNKERFLKDCLDSLINQTYKNIEIICINDGSTDHSLDILRDYADKDDRLIIISQENKGAGNARNTGIKIATGRYLQFLDADDFFELDMLEDMVKQADEKKADIVICNALEYNEETKIEEAHRWLNVQDLKLDVFSYHDVENIFNITTSSVWNKLYKKELIIDNEIWYQEIPSNNDTAFSVITLLLAKRITYVDKFYIHYRYYNDTFRISSSREKYMQCSVMAYKKIIKVMKEKRMYGEVQDLLNQQMYNSANYELAFCDDEAAGKAFLRQMCRLMSGTRRIKLRYRYEGYSSLRYFYLFGKIPFLTSIILEKRKIFYLFNCIPLSVKRGYKG